MSDFWQDEFEHKAPISPAREWFIRGVAFVVAISFVGALAWGAYSMLSGGKSSKKQVMQISLLAPLPPPPPPPPQEKPPEPEIKEEVKIPEPTPDQPKEAEAAPPGEQLGLDASGSGTGDGFGLAARKGGRDITEIGGGTGGNRAQFAWFIGQVQGFLQDQFQKNAKLRSADYRVVLRIWFSPDGKVERYELVNGTGNGETDHDFAQALEQLPRMKVAIPADLPQPLRLRVTSRGAG
jgi:protein TonB